MTAQDRKSIGQKTAGEAHSDGVARSEKELQKLISLELNRIGIAFVSSGMHRKTSTQLGTPDFLFALNGKPFAVEVKIKGSTTRPEQDAMLFDLTNPIEQGRCFHYTNLQPLWAADNLTKWVRTV